MSNKKKPAPDAGEPAPLRLQRMGRNSDYREAFQTWLSSAGLRTGASVLRQRATRQRHAEGAVNIPDACSMARKRKQK
jgi:hypothetical protein